MVKKQINRKKMKTKTIKMEGKQKSKISKKIFKLSFFR